MKKYKRKKGKEKRHFYASFCSGWHQPALFQGNLSLIGIFVPILLALGIAGRFMTVMLFKLPTVFPAENCSKKNEWIYHQHVFSALILGCILLKMLSEKLLKQFEPRYYYGTFYLVLFTHTSYKSIKRKSRKATNNNAIKCNSKWNSSAYVQISVVDIILDPALILLVTCPCPWSWTHMPC